jgi:CubicO group peptidase (beta-lactamase class C family)
LDGLLILHRGRIVHESYRNGMDATSRHMLFSMTKSLVGLITELLALDGAIDLARPASAYVPELSGTPFGGAILRDLLDMRDGVYFDETYADPYADIHRYSAHYWGDGEGGVRAALSRLAARGTSPGRFAYRTPVTDVIGWALAKATGRGLAALLSERVWQPIGAESDALFVLDTGGNEIAAAGLNATLRDLGRFAQMLLDGGRVGSVQVVPAQVVDRLLAGGDRDAFAASGLFPTRPGWSYRSQWWVQHEPRPALSALGVFGQRIHIEPESGLAVIRFGSHPVASNAETDVVHAQVFRALAARLNGTRQQ